MHAHIVQDAVWMEHKDFIKEQGMVLLEWTSARRAGPTVCVCVRVCYALFLLRRVSQQYTKCLRCMLPEEQVLCIIFYPRKPILYVVMILLRNNGMREGG